MKMEVFQCTKFVYFIAGLTYISYTFMVIADVSEKKYGVINMLRMVKHRNVIFSDLIKYNLWLYIVESEVSTPCVKHN